MIIVIFLIHYWYLHEITKIHLIKLPFKIILTIFGTLAGLFLCGSTATIDTGTRNQPLHLFCASNFFKLMILNVLINQYYVYKIRSQAKHIITDYSILLKAITVVAFVLCLLASTQDFNMKAENDISEKNPNNSYQNYGSDIGNYIEYAGTFAIMLYIFSLADDWRDFRLQFVRRGKGDIVLTTRFLNPNQFVSYQN